MRQKALSRLRVQTLGAHSHKEQGHGTWEAAAYGPQDWTKELRCLFLSDLWPIWIVGASDSATTEFPYRPAGTPSQFHEADPRRFFCGINAQNDALTHLIHSFLWNTTIPQVTGICQWLT